MIYIERERKREREREQDIYTEREREKERQTNRRKLIHSGQATNVVGAAQRFSSMEQPRHE